MSWGIVRCLWKNRILIEMYSWFLKRWNFKCDKPLKIVLCIGLLWIVLSSCMRGCSNVNEAKEISAIKLSWQSRLPMQATAIQHLTLGYIYIKNKAEIFISNLWFKSFEEILITHSQVEPWPQENGRSLEDCGEADTRGPASPQSTTQSVGHQVTTDGWLPTAHHRPYTFVLTSGPRSIYTRNIT